MGGAMVELLLFSREGLTRVGDKVIDVRGEAMMRRFGVGGWPVDHGWGVAMVVAEGLGLAGWWRID